MSAPLDKMMTDKAMIDAALNAALDRRGRRYPETVYAHESIARLYRLAARSFYAGLPAVVQADQLEKATLRYAAGAFRRSHGPACEPQHRGSVNEIIHLVLRLRDRCPRARTIRRWL